MADEKEKDGELELDNSGKKKKMIIIIIAVIVLLGGGAGAYFFFMGGSGPDASQEQLDSALDSDSGETAVEVDKDRDNLLNKNEKDYLFNFITNNLT